VVLLAALLGGLSNCLPPPLALLTPAVDVAPSLANMRRCGRTIMCSAILSGLLSCDGGGIIEAAVLGGGSPMGVVGRRWGGDCGGGAAGSRLEPLPGVLLLPDLKDAFDSNKFGDDPDFW